MTGQEAPIMITNKVDNYYSCETGLKVENAQGELLQELSQQKIPSIKIRSTREACSKLFSVKQFSL